MTETHLSPGKGTTTTQPKDWACQECGKKMTLKQAERVVVKGCPGCGGTDIDVNGGCCHA